MQHAEDIVQAFAPISLDEMSAVKLMNRVDTKYVTSRSRLSEVLRAAQEDYYAQEIDGQRIANYDTLYFDTPDLQMYTLHHNRKLVRQKVRIRRYVGSSSTQREGELTFLEIKSKNNHGRTKKKRIEVSGQDALLHPSEEVLMFMQKRCRYETHTLLPQLTTAFRRITLVNKAKTERLTIDMQLCWTNRQTGHQQRMDDLVIIELKRDGMTPSPMVGILQNLHIHPLKISKYCIGTALTNPQAKQNRFKVKIRKIQKIL